MVWGPEDSLTVSDSQLCLSPDLFSLVYLLDPWPLHLPGYLGLCPGEGHTQLEAKAQVPRSNPTRSAKLYCLQQLPAEAR